MIHWKKINKKDLVTIRRIVKRANKDIDDYDNCSLEMDICATHLSCPLKLEELLEADLFNFGHDILGIVNNINRQTGKLENCFFPRFAR
jgi:hypothetical protein